MKLDNGNSLLYIYKFSANLELKLFKHFLKTCLNNQQTSAVIHLNNKGTL